MIDMWGAILLDPGKAVGALDGIRDKVGSAIASNTRTDRTRTASSRRRLKAPRS